MARGPREKCESGIYHVMLRGIDGRTIFTSDEDCRYFLEILKKCKALSECKLYGYCLMGNHVHLLIGEGTETLGEFIKRISNRYVPWFNFRQSRNGHLFQDRYRSEPVKDDAYFMTVLRYIHQNPIRAGICKKMGEYPWSSYLDYKNEGSNGLTDISFALELLSKDSLLSFFHETNHDRCIDDVPLHELRSQEHSFLLFQELSGCETPDDFAQFNEAKQIEILKLCRQHGIPQTKLAAYTGKTMHKIRYLGDSTK